jgi:hypothetical protein
LAVARSFSIAGEVGDAIVVTGVTVADEEVEAEEDEEDDEEVLVSGRGGEGVRDDDGTSDSAYAKWARVRRMLAAAWRAPFRASSRAVVFCISGVGCAAWGWGSVVADETELSPA